MDIKIFKLYKEALAANNQVAVQKHMNVMVRGNLAFVKTIAKRQLHHSPNAWEDLVQAGSIGLVKAIEKWDPSRAAFSTLAAFWILHEIQTHLGHVGVKRYMEKPGRVVRQERAFESQNGREATPEELGVSARKWERWRTLPRFIPLENPNCGSHSSTVHHHWSSNLDHSQKNPYKYEHCPDDELLPEENLVAKQDHEDVAEVLQDLAQDEQDYIRLAFFEDKNAAEIAKELSVSRAYVNVLRDAALQKLRDSLQ